LVTCVVGMAYKNLSAKSHIFLRYLHADLDLIMNEECFTQIWFWTNLCRWDSSDWWDVWFWT